MKFRTTLILLLIALGIASYLYFVEPHQQTTREAKESSRQVLKVDRDHVTAISIRSPESKVDLAKKGDAWFLEEPVKDRADSMAMSQLFTSLEGLKYDAALDGDGKALEKDQMKDFGLANSETKIRITEGNKSVELLFGKEAAVEGKTYARLEGANTVYVIGSELKNQLGKKADEFRDKRLTDLAVAKVNRAVLKTPHGEIEVEKKNEQWLLVRPLKARGDNAKIGDFVSQALTARIETFIAGGTNTAAYGLEQPRATFSIYTEDAEQPTVLQIGGKPQSEADKEKTYAKLSSRDSVVILPKSIDALLETKPNDLRDRNLVRVESDIVDRITIEPAAKDKIVLARDKEKWVRKAERDEPIDSGSATRLLNDLNGTTIGTFAADVATDLPKFGLDTPVLKVTLSSYSTENTAESKAGEKPIVSVHFGRIEGNEIYAKLDDEPFIVTVSADLLGSIVTDPIQLQDLVIYPFKPEEVNTFTIERAEQPALHFERDGEKKWKLAKGDGAINQVAAQSLVNTLAGLRAVRWVGAVSPDHGFDKPSMLLSFKARAGGGKLTIGTSNGEQMWFAAAEGKAGAFLLSRPDAEGLQASLLEKPAEPVGDAKSEEALPGKSNPADNPGATPAAPAETPAAPRSNPSALPSEAPAQSSPP